jgi:hypothetical protein
VYKNYQVNFSPDGLAKSLGILNLEKYKQWKLISMKH